MDCEFASNENGLTVISISIVDYYGQTLLNTLVKP